MTITREFSIAIVTCWYGPWPWYFIYFLKSCETNSSISFFIISDQDEKDALIPTNVHIINMPLGEVKLLAERKLNLKINFSNPYKLCDFKPAYGFLFQELLCDFDFWVHSDLDIIWGDIRGFMTSELLSEYDILSSRHDYLTGSFCMYKNNSRMNQLFMQSKDYKTVFTQSQNFCFDECGYKFEELNNGIDILTINDCIESMTHVVRKAQMNNSINAFFDFLIIEGTPGNIIWHDGKIYYKRMFEAMFYHLIKFKKDCINPRIFKILPDSICFGPRKIFIKKNLFETISIL